MKLNLMCELLLWSSVAFADSAYDVIVTTHAERIEAIITEITPTALTYYTTTNLEDSIRVLPINEVSFVIYKNNDVQIFEGKGTAVSQTTKQSLSDESLQAKVTPLNYTILSAKPRNVSKQYDMTNFWLGMTLQNTQTQELLFDFYVKNKSQKNLLVNSSDVTIEYWDKKSAHDVDGLPQQAIVTMFDDIVIAPNTLYSIMLTTRCPKCTQVKVNVMMDGKK